MSLKTNKLKLNQTFMCRPTSSQNNRQLVTPSRVHTVNYSIRPGSVTISRNTSHHVFDDTLRILIH